MPGARRPFPPPVPLVRPSAVLLVVAALASAGCAVASPRCPPCRPCDATAGNPWRDAAQRHGFGASAVWSYLRDRYDADGDGRVTEAESGRERPAFGRLDRDHDGAWTAADFAGATRMSALIGALALERIAAATAPSAASAEGAAAEADGGEVWTAAAQARGFAAADVDRSGTLDEAELDAALARAQATPVEGVLDMPAGVRPFPYLLEAADRDASGTLRAEELEAWRATYVASRAAEASARAAKATSAPAASAPVAPRAAPPGVGDLAPDFTLRSRGGTRTRTLSDLRGTPVVLVFGSWTCPPFRASAPWIRAAYDRHRDRVRFLFVYVREAHAVDGGAPMPSADQPLVEEPRSFEARRALADTCALELHFGVFETLVDELDDAVAKAYAAPPVRLYVVDGEGRVAYRSGPGPFGLRRDEFDAAVDRVAR